MEELTKKQKMYMRGIPIKRFAFLMGMKYSTFSSKVNNINRFTPEEEKRFDKLLNEIDSARQTESEQATPFYQR